MGKRTGPRVWKRRDGDVSIRDPAVATGFRAFVGAWLARRHDNDREPSLTHLAHSLPHWEKPEQGWSVTTLHHILNETRAYRSTFVERAAIVARGILEDPRERALLVALAKRDAAPDPAARRAAQQEVDLARQALDIQQATFEHFDEVLPQWHRTVLLELAACADFQDDPAWIRPRLAVPVSEAEIARSLAVLERTGLLVRDAHGALRPRPDLSQLQLDRLTKDPDNAALARLRRRSLIDHYKGLLPLVAPSLDHLDREHRMMLGTVVHLPRRLLPKLQESLQKLLQEEGLRSDATAEPADTVYQVGVFLLPAAVSDPTAPPEWFSHFRDAAARERPGDLQEPDDAEE